MWFSGKEKKTRRRIVSWRVTPQYPRFWTSPLGLLGVKVWRDNPPPKWQTCLKSDKWWLRITASEEVWRRRKKRREKISWWVTLWYPWFFEATLGLTRDEKLDEHSAVGSSIVRGLQKTMAWNSRMGMLITQERKQTEKDVFVMSYASMPVTSDVTRGPARVQNYSEYSTVESSKLLLESNKRWL